MHNKIHIHLVADLNVGITLTTDWNSPAPFWPHLDKLFFGGGGGEMNNKSGKIRVNFLIVTEIFRSVFRNFEFNIIKL